MLSLSPEKLMIIILNVIKYILHITLRAGIFENFRFSSRKHSHRKKLCISFFEEKRKFLNILTIFFLCCLGPAFYNQTPLAQRKEYLSYTKSVI